MTGELLDLGAARKVDASDQVRKQTRLYAALDKKGKKPRDAGADEINDRGGAGLSPSVRIFIYENTNPC